MFQARVSPVEVGSCVQIGLLCIQHQSIDRPNICKTSVHDHDCNRSFRDQNNHYLHCGTKTVWGMNNRGYMSPEYAWTGMFSEKSDIYAFGVVMLEIISGKKISSFSSGEEDKSLIEYAWDSWCKTGGVDLLDQDISGSCSPVEVMRCVQIGLLCIQQQAIDRPNIAKVVSMITTATDIPKPKQPVFALQNRDSGVSVAESLNDLTQTAIHGR